MTPLLRTSEVPVREPDDARCSTRPSLGNP
jgi:hypothetical protein